MVAIPTVLVDEHRRLDAQLLPFAGFLMPIRYGSIFDEHRAVRERAGIFDLSHMAQLELSGEGALSFLDRLSTNLLSTLGVGKARYTILTQDDGGAIDDIIVYRLADRIFVVANAANTNKVISHFQEQAPADISLTHLRDQALIAIQGPRSASILQRLVDTNLTALAKYSCTPAHLGDIPLLLARTGYTGEDGFELFVPNTTASEIFQRLLATGEEDGILPAGLAARDILRLEAGMPLYGNELSESISPIQAGLEWAVRFDKGAFLGRDSLFEEQRVPTRRIVGLQLQARIPMRTGYPVLLEGKPIGEIRSATIAPSVGGASIATALVDTPYTALGQRFEVPIRGTLYPAEVVSLPFYHRSQVRSTYVQSC